MTHPYTDTIPAEALDIMAVNFLDWPPRDGISLTGLRSATLQVLDTAASVMGITRTAAHARLWPQAVRLAKKYQVDFTDPLHLEADLTNRLICQSREDRFRVRRLLSELSDQRRTRTPRVLVRLLAGAALWLPLIGEPGRQALDAFAREPLPLALLLMDALAQRGLSDLCIDNDGGRAVEHVSIGHNGPLGISAGGEVVSVPPAQAADLHVEYYDTNDELVSHEYTGAVTIALIREVVDHVAEIARRLNIC